MSNPRSLGKYQLVAEIARGGMGLVYLAISSGLGGFNKILVIKELKPELVEETSFLEMFLEEARLAAELNHPNIVTTYEVGMDDKRPFIVMDYLEGQTLSRIHKKARPQTTLAMELRTLSAALQGLHYAHTRETFDGSPGAVVHRDISPQNIFVTYDGQVKVVDFGIAKASDTTIETRAGVFKGKPSYMAPQQLRGDPDARADVFSIGVILWEAVAKRRMWPKMTDVEILTALLKSDIPKIDDLAPEAPEALRKIVDKAVAPDAEARYQTARALADDINDYLSSIGDKTTLGDFGTAMSAAFADERQKVRRLVEKAVADAKAAASSGAPVRLPSIAPPAEETSQPSGSRAHEFVAATGPISMPPRSGMTAVSPISATPYSAGTPGAAAVPILSHPPERRSPWPWIVGLVAIVGIVAIVLSFKATASHDDKSTPAKTADAPPPPVSVVPAATPAVAPPPATETASAAATVSVAKPKPAAAFVPAHVPAYVPPAPKPAATPSTVKVDCSTPFYFEGSKKIFKPGCL